MNDHCYPSKLPYSLWYVPHYHDECITNLMTFSIHTNSNMKDGYLDYAADHVDFHDDGCKTDSFAGPSGDGTFQDCEIPC